MRSRLRWNAEEHFEHWVGTMALPIVVLCLGPLFADTVGFVAACVVGLVGGVAVGHVSGKRVSARWRQEGKIR